MPVSCRSPRNLMSGEEIVMPLTGATFNRMRTLLGVSIFAFTMIIAAQTPRAVPQAPAGINSLPAPEETEVWEPVPRIVAPGAMITAPPADAVVLFDGTNLDEWVNTNDKKPAGWKIEAGVLTVVKQPRAGNIETKRTFKNYQLHLEWLVPKNIAGADQARGNSGIFLASTGPGDAGYELQILDSFDNPTYVNGQAGSVYKQFAPLVNASRKPGEWQLYDVV